MERLEVVGVRVEMPSNQPLVLLREVGGDRHLPIWIGAVEATAIAFAQEGVEPPLPLTHDLLKDLLVALGRSVRQVRITDLVDGVFYAVIDLGEGVEVSARPSDAIALALRCDAPILGDEQVLEAAGVPVADDEEDEVKAFREFIENVSPEDFERGDG